MGRQPRDRGETTGSQCTRGDPTRRGLLGAFAAGGLAATAGCLQGAVDSVTLHSAAPAVVSPSVVDDTGYEYRDTEEYVDTETVARKTIEITYYVSSYVRTIDVPILDLESVEVGLFGLLSTPEVSVAGREFNPLADASRDEIVEQAQQEEVDLTIGDSIGNRTVAALGDDISVETFAGEADFEDRDELEVVLDIAQPSHDGDHLVIVGATPDDDRLDRDDELERIDAMIAGIDHGDHVDGQIE